MKSLSLIIFLLALNFFGAAQDTSTVIAEEPILDFCEVEPQYPGGQEAMAKFLQTTVMYPEEARERSEQGTVYVQFVVNQDGSISEVKAIKSVTKLLDAEAIRVIKLMPNWTPGMQNGKVVRVKYIVPINFTIASNKKK